MTEMHHFGDEVWLHTVIGAKTDSPESHRIQSPNGQSRMEDIQVTEYIVHKDAWRELVG